MNYSDPLLSLTFINSKDWPKLEASISGLWVGPSA